MAETNDRECALPASLRRLETAREEEQFARAPELIAFAMLIVAGGGMWFASAELLGGFKMLMREGLRLAGASPADTGIMLAALYAHSAAASDRAVARGGLHHGAGCACAAHAGSGRADRPGAYRARSRHRPVELAGQH